MLFPLNHTNNLSGSTTIPLPPGCQCHDWRKTPIPARQPLTPEWLTNTDPTSAVWAWLRYELSRRGLIPKALALDYPWSPKTVYIIHGLPKPSTLSTVSQTKTWREISWGGSFLFHELFIEHPFYSLFVGLE